MKNPKEGDWNQFWKKNVSNPSITPSWSKKRIIEILNPLIRKGNSALDAGCGSGFFSKYFLDSGMETFSLDYSDEALELTRKITNGKSRVMRHDVLDIELVKKIPQRFDLIFSDGLFEHFSADDQDAIMKNFYALLSKEGLLVTFVPNRWSPWELIRPFFMPGINETPFVLKSLVRLNKDGGLRILNSGGINVLPFAVSPDRICGSWFGMLLYTVAKRDVV